MRRTCWLISLAALIVSALWPAHGSATPYPSHVAHGSGTTCAAAQADAVASARSYCVRLGSEDVAQYEASQCSGGGLGTFGATVYFGCRAE